MRRSIRSPLPALAAGISLLVMLAGCASAPPDDSETDDTTLHATDNEQQDTPPSKASDYLDDLYADGLHEGVSPAAPGTAYIEVGGERIEFASLNCTINDEPGRGQFIVSASGETTDSGHRLYLSREIGPEIGFNWENEHVQLALLTFADSDDTTGRYSNSMAQHARDEGEVPKWLNGDGESPLVRVVGNEATAIGVLKGVPFAPNPLAAEFIAAATCP